MPKKPSASRHRLRTLVLLALVAIAVLAGLIVAPYRPAQLPVTVEVAPNQSLSTVAASLDRAGAVRSGTLFLLLAKVSGAASEIKAGDYRMIKPLSMLDWLAKLRKGEKSEYVVTIPEGFTFGQFRAMLQQHPALRHDTAGWSEKRILQKLGAEGSHAEGLFFPDTYYFLKGASDLDVLKRAHDKMQSELERSWQIRAGDLPYQSPYEMLILASLVEKETGHVEDRPQIAGVFINRLRIGMRLQTDPSVMYGVSPDFRGPLNRRQLRADTPYNTYTRAGLPPTPIALPGRAALEAAANPAATKALYFVARGDGSSHFSETLDEHNSAVHEYILGKK